MTCHRGGSEILTQPHQGRLIFIKPIHTAADAADVCVWQHSAHMWCIAFRSALNSRFPLLCWVLRVEYTSVRGP